MLLLPDILAKTGNLPKYNAASENRELWVEKYLHVVSKGSQRTFKNGV
jgi:hypothetical protein